MTPPDRPEADVAEALAAAAGAALENARRARRAEARLRWAQAATDMATALLSGADTDDVLRRVSRQVCALTDADMSGVLAPSVDDLDSMTVVAAVGHAGDDVEGVRVPVAGTYVGATLKADEARLIENIGTMPVVGHRAAAAVELSSGYGPAMLAPLGNSPDRGLLVTLRAAGRDPYCADDLDLMSAFAAHASVVLALARGQKRERSLQLQADRDRIARDLHDHVVQRIFATGLSLDRISRSLEKTDPAVAARISERVDELDGTIARIRSAIFELQQAGDASPVAVRRRIGEVVRSATEAHDLRPILRIRDEVEDLPPEVVHEVVAVVRELVTNVVRHARATRLTVVVTADEHVRAEVTDDGCGLPAVTARSGLANLADRAERRGGTLSISTGGSGTAVCWQIPRRPGH